MYMLLKYIICVVYTQYLAISKNEVPLFFLQKNSYDFKLTIVDIVVLFFKIKSHALKHNVFILYVCCICS